MSIVILWSLKSLSLAVVKGGLAAPRGDITEAGRPLTEASGKSGQEPLSSRATKIRQSTFLHLVTNPHYQVWKRVKSRHILQYLPPLMKVRWKVCKIELHIFTFLKKEWFLENISVSQAFSPSSNQVEEGEDREFCILGSFQFRKLLFSRYTPQHPIGDCLLNNIDERKKMI